MREYGATDTIFENVDALNPSVDTYQPETLPERQSELDEIYSALRPIEIGGTPINLLVYGETGQGKTVAVAHETRQIQEWAQSQDIGLTVIDISCKGLNKSYNVLQHLLKKLREKRRGPGEDFPRGFQKKELLQRALDEMDEIGGTIILILDEIDALGQDDYVLYELPRANLEHTKLSIIGITNDLTYRQRLDSDSRSSFSEDRIVFAPYSTDELRAILSRRVSAGLKDTGFICDSCRSLPCPHDPPQTPENLSSEVLEDGVISECANLAAEETGDARQALKIIFRATRHADEAGNETVSVSHVNGAHAFIKEQMVVEGLETLPQHKVLTVMALVLSAFEKEERATTSDIYSRYEANCKMTRKEARSQKRMRDFLKDLENIGLLNIHTGGGRSQENRYTLDVDLELVLDNLPSKDEPLGDVAKHVRNKHHRE